MEKNPSYLQSHSSKTHEHALADYSDTGCPVTVTGQWGDELTPNPNPKSNKYITKNC